MNKADIIRQLVQHDGWKLVEAFIQTRIDDHKGRLLNCPIDDVQSHRDAIKAYQSILVEVEVMMQDEEDN